MRLYEFERKEIDPNDIKHIIDTNCKQAASVLAGLNPVPLFRGTHTEFINFVSDIRDDRMPRNSEPIDAYAFDSLMKTLSLPFRKANTLSVTVDRSDANQYGPMIYQIYPFDGSSYLFSTKFSDLLEVSDHIMNKYYEHEGSYVSDSDIDQDILFKFIEENANIFFERLGLIATSDIKDLARAYGEVLIIGRPYLAIELKD